MNGMSEYRANLREAVIALSRAVTEAAHDGDLPLSRATHEQLMLVRQLFWKTKEER